MQRPMLAKPGLIILVLILQIVPLLLFPPQFFLVTSQDWWLGALLALMVVIADLVLLVGRSDKVWPWHLISFAQGFNVISRLMMVWPHATLSGSGGVTADVTYILFTAASVAMSVVLLWYTEIPDVRTALARQP